MTTLQVLSLLMMPAAGLLIGVGLLYITRREDRRHKLHPGE